VSVGKISVPVMRREGMSDGEEW